MNVMLAGFKESKPLPKIIDFVFLALTVNLFAWNHVAVLNFFNPVKTKTSGKQWTYQTKISYFRPRIRLFLEIFEVKELLFVKSLLVIFQIFQCHIILHRQSGNHFIKIGVAIMGAKNTTKIVN